MKAEQIMGLVQAYASAWSLVGGQFDHGQMLRDAEEAKAEVRKAIEAHLAALTKANSQAEHFEREWYLRGDELERLKEKAKPSIDKLITMRGLLEEVCQHYYQDGIEEGVRRAGGEA